MNAEEHRAYRQTARAAATQATRDRILDAALALFWEAPDVEATLDAVAARAGVPVQTVIRHFGGRDGVVAAAAEREAARVAAERDPAAAAGNPRRAIADLVAHYERIGEGVLRMLADERRIPALATVAAQGRAFHHGWVSAVFAGVLDDLEPDVRRRRHAQLAALTDVHVWKLLRDGGLTPDEVTDSVVELTERVGGGR
jgi:AcrR family transcriptional regulator